MLQHHPSLLCGKYLKKVLMCPFQLMHSDMQNGTDLLRRQKKETKQMSSCVPLNWDWGCMGGGYVSVVGRFCLISVCVCLCLCAGKGLSRCAQTCTYAYMHVHVCICNYQLLQTLPSHNYLPLSYAHPHKHTVLILNAWG